MDKSRVVRDPVLMVSSKSQKREKRKDRKCRERSMLSYLDSQSRPKTQMKTFLRCTTSLNDHALASSQNTEKIMKTTRTNSTLRREET